MTITTYHINHLMKRYSRQIRLIDQGRKGTPKTVSDTVKISAEGKKRIIERMKEQAIDQVTIQNGASNKILQG